VRVELAESLELRGPLPLEISGQHRLLFSRTSEGPTRNPSSELPALSVVSRRFLGDCSEKAR